MVKLSVEASHEDERGSITDLLVDKEINAVTSLTLLRGAVRGNHFHRQTTQWTLVTTGEITYAERKGDGPLKTHVAGVGGFFVSEPGVSHAIRAESDASIIVFTSGPRAGQEYESDTFREEVALL